MPRSRFAFRWKFGAILIGALALILGGCAETQLAIHSVKKITRIPKTETTKKDIETFEGPELTTSLLGEYKVGDPYEVGGVWYYPKVNPNYDEVGIASWYGPSSKICDPMWQCIPRRFKFGDDTAFTTADSA